MSLDDNTPEQKARLRPTRPQLGPLQQQVHDFHNDITGLSMAVQLEDKPLIEFYTKALIGAYRAALKI
jgi:hypothetical protein